MAKETFKQAFQAARDSGVRYFYWKGKKFPRSKMKEGAKNLPWEKEAYKMQDGLALKVWESGEI